MTEPAAAPAVIENGAAPAVKQGEKVHVGNIPYSTTEEELKEFFSVVGSDIENVKIIHQSDKRKNRKPDAAEVAPRSAGYGFIVFKTAEASKKAIELFNGKTIGAAPSERQLLVELAKPEEEKRKENAEKKSAKKRNNKKLAAASADASAAPAEGAPKAEGAEGAAKPKKARKPRKAKGAKAAGEAAAEGTPAAEATKEPKVKKPKAPKEKKAPRPPRDHSNATESETQVFVRNLGFSINVDDLVALFAEAGLQVDASKATIICQPFKPHRSKGFGFVDVGSKDNQKKAIEALHNKEVGGRALDVRVAMERPAKQAAEGGDVKADEAAPATVTA